MVTVPQHYSCLEDVVFPVWVDSPVDDVVRLVTITRESMLRGLLVLHHPCCHI